MKKIGVLFAISLVVVLISCSEDGVGSACDKGEILNKNRCICDAENHWVKDKNACVCETGFVEIDGKCISACDENTEIMNAENQTCECNADKHWTGSAGNCQCESGYKLVEGQCEVIPVCHAEQEIYNSATNQCDCNADNHWKRDNNTCVCDTNYVEIDGECVSTLCGGKSEVYNLDTNSCECNTAKHWVGVVGRCQCESGYVESEDTCKRNTNCGSSREIFSQEADACVCNAAAHWAGESGSCDCAKGYLEIDDVCYERPACGAELGPEAYNVAISGCQCNLEQNWDGELGSCTCEKNFALQDGVCVTTLENCRDSGLRPSADTQVGDIVSFGNYEQYNTTTTCRESINWRVVEKDEQAHKLLLVSTHVLDVQVFNEIANKVADTVPWKRCTLRSWLNGLDGTNNVAKYDYSKNNFMKRAFSQEELKSIVKVDDDSVFILTIKEIYKYFDTKKDQMSEATKYVVMHKSYVVDEKYHLTHDGTCSGEHCYSSYWIKDPSAFFLGEYGESGYSGGWLGTNMNNRNVGVRPVIWVSYDK